MFYRNQLSDFKSAVHVLLGLNNTEFFNQTQQKLNAKWHEIVQIEGSL